MLSAEGCRQRRQRLWSQLQPAPDWILITEPLHQLYFSNYWQSPFLFRSNEARALLVLAPDGAATLVVDNLLAPFAERAAVDEVVAPVWYRGIESAPARAAHLIRHALERLERCPGKRFGIEAPSAPVALIEGLRSARGTVELVDVDPLIHQQRRRKDPDEIALLRRSMAAGAAGQAAGLHGIKPGMTELEAYCLVRRAALESAGEQVLVYGDFVSGPRCEAVGGPPSERIIQKGDLVLLDFSVVLYGYRGDFTNTFACQSRATAEQHRLFDACCHALQAGEGQLRAGTPCRAVDGAVRASFAAAGLAAAFPHHSGHGIGLGHPEPPFLVPESSETLLTGDVVTLEPGLYVPGTAGMRYERNYLITEDSGEILSHHEIRIDGA